ncbi:UBX domain-containing protein 7 isoform X1 [Neodiprion pinetum]|uniref:UBX domain-containing protein 7 isoform X1 n=1 Tax=Neodiprion lecontei TaxID=441921 RepID=A0A6J0CG58_NEOLC|nr:UBX domain-containing protein 7 isoform X1 [Neodiprion lecontei]XP_046481446.1 UBX domain-containing protein 7 isoform X1 [Neodiprion pinetum]
MDRELIEKFIEVTGSSEAVARQYLVVADGNVETAISLMFEGGGAEAVADVDGQTEPPEPEIRPPILPTREVLVPTQPVCAFPRASNSVFDRFRDFAVETQRQEEEMARRVTGVKKMSPRKSKRLEDLFRPPYDIMFLGSFIEAREHAKLINRWLLVNVQNPLEFSCQILNRDLWPNEQIRDMVRDHFVLWQVISNTSDGQRFIDFYNVTDYPYLAVLDPRTGECVRTYDRFTVEHLVSGLGDMLSNHLSPETAPQVPSTATDDWLSCPAGSMVRRCDVPSESSASGMTPESKKARGIRDTAVESANNERVDAGPSASNVILPRSGVSILGKRSRTEELSKTKKHEILHSLLQKKNGEPSNSEPNSTVVNSNDEPSLRLCLRLPNGGKETISMGASDTIKSFLGRMETMGYPPSEHTYLVPFPRTNIGALSQQTRLSETILFPSNTVFITKI